MKPMKAILYGAGGFVLLAIVCLFTLRSFVCEKLCNGPEPSETRPMISLADLMIVKLTDKQNRTDSGRVLVDKIIELRKYDSAFYKAFFNAKNDDLRKKYFYSRPGSCCPCSPNEAMCCSCPPESSFGVPGEGDISQGAVSKNVFMFTSMASPQQAFSFAETKVNDMFVYSLPKDTPKGTYTSTIKNGVIDLTLTIEVAENGTFHIESVK